MNKKIKQIKEYLEKKLKSKERNFIGITDILRCPLLPNNNNNKKVILGNITDKFIKKILEKFNINTSYQEKIKYEDILFYIHPDGIDEDTIYEVKTSYYLEKPTLNYLLQAFTYAYFTNKPNIVFLFLTPDNILVYEYKTEDLKDKLLPLLKIIFQKYKNKEPYTELCQDCFFKTSCRYSYKKKELDNIASNFNVKKVYILKFPLPKEGIALWNKFLYKFQRIDTKS
jgi:hypothetical protein